MTEMEIKKRNLIFLIYLIPIVIIVYIVSFYLKYNADLVNEDKNFVYNEFKPLSFRGKIYELNKELTICFTTLVIETKYKKLAYGITYCDKDSVFVNYAEVGDSIIKASNSLEIVIIKNKTSKSKKFIFPFDY